MDDDSASQVTPAPFAIRDCALITLATGIKAQNLREFLEGVRSIPHGSLDHHFWGRLLRPQFDEPEYNNDFASWVWRGLHDKPLAERLSMISPSEFEDLEALRQEVVEVIEERLDESEMMHWAPADQQFDFLTAQIVVFDTGFSFADPSHLCLDLHQFSTGSIYYHFIDARRRTPGRCDDFSAWLAGFDGSHSALRDRLSAIDPYFSSLKEIRQLIAEAFRAYCEERA
ncbi:MAG TPA: DUF5752 family protein [Desulfuromonadales bacterium]|nr:DUF5752 family protein [Desulfuromonadales bacterium]